MQLEEYLTRQQPVGMTWTRHTAKFARRAGVSVHALRKWLRGERIPRPKYIQKMTKLTEGLVKAEDWID